MSDRKAAVWRAARAGLAVYLLGAIGMFIMDMLSGTAFAFASAAAAVIFASLILLLTRTIRRREALDRPRPDYSAIARMEQEVYGETFKHDGAPETDSVAELNAMMDDLVKLKEGRKRTLIIPPSGPRMSSLPPPSMPSPGPPPRPRKPAVTVCPCGLCGQEWHVRDRTLIPPRDCDRIHCQPDGYDPSNIRWSSPSE